jgi:hypothetical protein
LDVLASKCLIVIKPSYLMLNSGAAPGKVKMRLKMVSLRGEYWWQWFRMLRKVKIVFGEMLSFWRRVGFGKSYPGLQSDDIYCGRVWNGRLVADSRICSCVTKQGLFSGCFSSFAYLQIWYWLFVTQDSYSPRQIYAHDVLC